MTVQQPSNQMRRASSDEVGETTIACSICDAVYAPTRSQEHLLLAPTLALESAFMSMCHFCFRCRRPACPACWDDVHGICGNCVQEINLSFRTISAPLSALLFTARRRAQLERDTSSLAPLICVLPGRFYDAPPSPIDEVATVPVHVVPSPAISEQEEVARAQKQLQQSISPVRKHDHQEDIAELDTRPAIGRGKKVARIGERVLTIVLLLLLLIVIAMIVAASLSEQVNTLISRTLHVDIRAELAYLWQLITQLF